jgi:flagellar hook-associated protein 1 FlgK
VTTADGRTINPTVGTNGELEFDGVSIKPQGTPQAGDSFVMNPTAGAAGKISVAITKGDQIAASSVKGEESNNENIKDMLAIKTETLIGNGTLTEAYSSLVSSVGSSMKALEADNETTSKAAAAIEFEKQSVSGVDLTEETVKFQMYTQYYQANAQVLQAANTLFDTLLSLR